MPFDGLLLHSVVGELRHLLINARVHRIRQPRPAELVLTLRQPGSNYHLLLSADPAEPRLHLTTGEDANPLSPYTFCLLLRKHLEPARLLAVEQPGWERMVCLRFEARGEDGRRVERHLILEIMGRHSNLLLLDPAAGVILDGIRRVTPEQSRHRAVLPGRPYIAPPTQSKDDPAVAERDTFIFHLRHVPGPQEVARALAERYDGLSPAGAREILCRAGLAPGIIRQDMVPDAGKRVWEVFRQMVTAAADGQISPWGASDATGKPAAFWIFPLTHLALAGQSFPDTNNLLDWYYTGRQRHAALEGGRGELRRVLQAALERSRRRLAHQEEALRAAALAPEHRLKGELLLAQLHTVQPGEATVTLENYYEPDKPLVVELDPSRSAGVNAEKYFRRYQKAKNTADQAGAQKKAIEADLQYLESVLQAIEQATSPADLAEIKAELQAEGLLTAPERRAASTGAKPALGYLRMTAQDGTEIVVGKNNRQNDSVTMSLARPDDLWLHVKDAPGAHVVVRSGGQPLQPETLNLAAQLAAYYSKARHSSQVPVDYCPRRQVRKPKGSRPGFVIYDHYQTVYITPDVAEIERLSAIYKNESMR